VIAMTDSCPNCCRRGVEPIAVRRRGDAIAHGYQCPGCGHRWATSRLLSAYSEIHRARRRSDNSAASRTTCDPTTGSHPNTAA
jgi:transposase-like protein